MSFLQKLLKFTAYCRRGYNLIIFGIHFANFIILTWKLVLEPVVGSDPLLLVVYVLTMGLLIASLCGLIGWIDYRRGLYRVEAYLMAVYNPAWATLLRALYYYIKGDRERALNLLEPLVQAIEKSRVSRQI